LKFDSVKTRFELSDGCYIKGTTLVELLQSNANLYLNFDGPNGDSFIYFYTDGSPTTVYFKWDETNKRFETSDDFYSDGGLMANGNVFIDVDAGSVNSYVYFYGMAAYLRYYQTADIFYINKKLFMTAAADVTGLLTCDSFRIDQTPTNGAPTPDKYITISCNGTNYKIGVQAV